MNNKKNLKGIVLAGGAGTRLYPASLPISKILLPVYNKPMIYYPLATLMLAGIRDIMIISNPRDIGNFESLLAKNNFGLNFSFAVQKEPRGIAESLIIAEDFIGEDNVALILGDNIFHGNNFGSILKNAFLKNEGATVFGYKVKNPSQLQIFWIPFPIYSHINQPSPTSARFHGEAPSDYHGNRSVSFHAPARR